jgi:methionine synthase II (cobalamin-independent)
VRRIWPFYERRLLEELDEITRAIPHGDLAIQIDIATEMHSFLEVPELQNAYPIEELVEAFARLGNRVPTDVELGIHLCYGDPGHKHVREPTDTGRMVDLYHRLATAIQRPITWLHMPVPRDRDDESYFSPLHNLRLKSGTELYLGLIHLTDGIVGAKRRVAAAERVVSNFGIATECGFGRRPPDTVPELLRLHRAAVEQL